MLKWELCNNAFLTEYPVFVVIKKYITNFIVFFFLNILIDNLK